jgi:hypothetical protein
MLNQIAEKYSGQPAKICAMVILGLLLPLSLSAQESTLNNTNGLWLDDAIWSDATGPGTSSIASDVHIYGNVVSGTGLDFIAGDLFIHDTLTIYGNLTLGDTLELTIDPGGILIVRGNLTLGDTVNVWTSGQMVVTGAFSILGDDEQGSFDNDGVLYVFDATPNLKGGTGYGDFTCGFPVDSCSLYDESDLLASGLASFYLAGSFSIEESGPTTFCLGDSVVLSVTDTATSYQWYVDDTEIIGATIFSYAAKTSGDYHVTFFIGTDSLVMDKVPVVANPLPVVTVTGLEAAYCEGVDADTLVGGPPGGFFVASPDLTILGVGDSAEFDPVLAGSYEFKYYFTDGLGCVDTATVSTTVNPLPVVNFTGLELEYCDGEDQDTLTGSQAGGVYLGSGITDNTDGTAYFDPATVGTYDITYYYTNGFGCSDTAIQSVTVHALPVVDFTGLTVELCIMDDADTLVGNQAPAGTFSGGTVADQGDGTGIFTPLVDGVYDIYYAYTDGFGCRDSAMHSVTVHQLPVVTIGNYDTIWDVNDPAFFIAGAPVGGTFSGKGISGITYDPALAGVGFDTVVYAFMDGNSCTNYDTIIFEIRDYDFKAGARYLRDIDGWCSPEAYYTTVGATPDETRAGCWSLTGPNNNRWFMFQATTVV